MAFPHLSFLFFIFISFSRSYHGEKPVVHRELPLSFPSASLSEACSVSHEQEGQSAQTQQQPGRGGSGGSGTKNGNEKNNKKKRNVSKAVACV